MATSIEAQFFADVDANGRLGIDSEAALWAWIDAGATVGLAADEWEMAGGSGTYFRGQASAAFGLTSKLYRDLRMGADAAGIGEASESDLAQVERSLIESMRHEGLGRRMSDGELLMVMQHHGIATRLMDVSATPKEALFFACDQHAEQDGRFFVFNLRGDCGADYDSMELAGLDDLPWEGAARGQRYADGAWTTRVAVVEDGALDPRMRAQNGRFLTGGLARKYAGAQRRLRGGTEVSREDHARVCSLHISFPKTRTRGIPAGFDASGWSVRVDAGWKAGLMRRLRAETDPITRDTMYPPVNEVMRLARRIVEEKFSV